MGAVQSLVLGGGPSILLTGSSKLSEASFYTSNNIGGVISVCNDTPPRNLLEALVSS